MTESLREDLADLCHEQWAGWMQYLFEHGMFNDDRTFTIDADKTQRWERQMFTPYSELSETEQDSDRKGADRFLALLEANSKVITINTTGPSLGEMREVFEDVLRGMTWGAR